MTKSKVGQDDSAEEKKEKRRLRAPGSNGKSIVAAASETPGQRGGVENGNEDPQEWAREFPKRSKNDGPSSVAKKIQLTAAESLELPRRAGRKDVFRSK